MSNFMTRRFTLREKILLGLLIVILLVGLYFFLVHYPIQNRMNEIAQEREEVQARLDIAEIRKGIYDRMQAELKSIFELPPDEITYMPKHDNLNVLIERFDAIFKGIEVRFNYGTPQTSNGIVSRAIGFSFSVADFDTAKKVLKELTGTGYRCLMSNITLSPGSGDIQSSELSISGTITFYELA